MSDEELQRPKLKKAGINHKYKYREWEFMPVFTPHPGEHGLPENLEQAASDVTIESICGGVDDSQPVEQYDGTLGVTIAFVNDHQRPVGQLQWNNNLAAIYNNPGNVSGVRWGTGTLISCNLFLTAGHCFDQAGGGWNRPLVNGTNIIIPPAEIASIMHVNFNYQVDSTGNLHPDDEYAITDLVEYRLNGLDYAIVRLANNPGAKYGFTRIAPVDVNINDMLCIIGHPAGLPKRIEAGPCTGLVNNQIRYNDIDTLGGNSGSGILGPAGTIVGVHTNGGCDQAAIGHNHGVRISSIIAASPIVSNLINTKQKFMDDGCLRVKLKIEDDDIFKFLKDRKLKRLDDHKHKIFDDQKLKILDDVKLKHLDDIPKVLSDKRKNIDDVKTGSYDKNVIVDGSPWLGNISQQLRQRGSIIATSKNLGRSPFILSTPHHTKVEDLGQTASGIIAQEKKTIISDYETLLLEIGQEIQISTQNLEALQELYENLLIECKKLKG